MRFNAARFDRHLTNMGQQVTWRPSYSCSCVNPDTGSADPTCQLCRKKGRVWAAPVSTVIALASQKTQAEWAKMGMWESGDVVASIPQVSPAWDSGQYDRVTMLNAADRFSETMKRGAPNETLAAIQVKSIERVFWRHQTTQALVEGGLPTVGADGSLTWASGAPPVGTSYSITGWKYVDYFVWGDFPSSRNMHSGMRLPKRVVLRRWDLLGRN